jgi:hypothetical protein
MFRAFTIRPIRLMGLCISAVDLEDEDDIDKQSRTKPQKTADKAKATADKVDVSVPGSESDADFKLMMKEVVIMFLEKLCVALEYEKEDYNEVATKLKKKGYMSIMNPESFKEILSTYLNIPDVDKSNLKPSDINYEQDNYLLFLRAAKNAPFKQFQQASKKDMVKSFAKACTQTQKSLQAAADAADKSDLKLHLYFFVNCLDVLQTGDLVSTPGKLTKNIESLCSGEVIKKKES